MFVLSCLKTGVQLQISKIRNNVDTNTHTHQNMILQFVYYIYTHIYIFTSISIYLRVHSKTLVVTHAHAFVNMTQGGEVVFASTSHIDMMIASLVLKNMFVLCVPLL